MAKILVGREIKGKDSYYFKQQHERIMLREIDQVHSIKFHLSGTNHQNHCPSITSLEFDEDGILLAAGNSVGNICIFDFTDYVLASSTIKNKVKGGDNEYTYTMPIVKHVSTHQSYSINCIKWNPINQNEIAISYRDKQLIDIYNLVS